MSRKITVTRRGFLAGTAAATTVRSLPQIATRAKGRRILALVYDKSVGAMRVIDRWVP